MTKLDVVIVNWNAGFQLQECVTSVLAHAGRAVARIIVVDNGSTDGSIDSVATLPGVDVIRVGENRGFAAACNLGAARGSSPYLLFLNPDTRVEPDSLSVPLAFMDRRENADVGICGIQLVDEQGKVSGSCARFPTLGRFANASLGLDKLPGLRGAGMIMIDWDHGDNRLVDQVMGAFFMIRREVFEHCRGFDERFFIYFEEVDLSLRVRQYGFRSYFLADAKAIHTGGGCSRQVKAHRLFYSLRSRLYYGFKHFSPLKAWALLALTLFVEPITRCFLAIFRLSGSDLFNTWRAYGMLFRSLSKILRGARCR